MLQLTMCISFSGGKGNDVALFCLGQSCNKGINDNVMGQAYCMLLLTAAMMTLMMMTKEQSTKTSAERWLVWVSHETCMV
jgi:hypothetical protein